MTTTRSGTALVTGSGASVGRAIALALADDRPVAVLGRRAGPLEETVAGIAGRGGRAAVVPGGDPLFD